MADSKNHVLVCYKSFYDIFWRFTFLPTDQSASTLNGKNTGVSLYVFIFFISFYLFRNIICLYILY